MHLPPFDPPDVLIVSHQRSGTHLIESALAKHPQIRCRGECFLRYLRSITKHRMDCVTPYSQLFINANGYVNIGILMYDLVAIYESYYGSLTTRKIIHLLRDPLSVAKSIVQKKTNCAYYGPKYKAHTHFPDQLLPHQVFDISVADHIVDDIRKQQIYYSTYLGKHSNVLTLNYESITRNREISRIPPNLAVPILGFLGLEHHELTTKLRKTGLWVD